MKQAYFRSLFCLAVASIYIWLWHQDFLFSSPKISQDHLWTVLLLAIAIALPFTKLIRCFVIGFFIATILCFVDAKKRGAVVLPLTSWDLWIVAKRPSDFLSSVGIPKTYSSLVAIVFTLLLIAYLIKQRKPLLDWVKNNYNKCAYGIISVILAVAIFQNFYHEYGKFALEQHAIADYDYYNLGVLGVLAYSTAEISAKKTSPMITNVSHGREIVGNDEILNSAAKFFRASNQKNLQPNIVFILAESTFDPNAVFNLKSSQKSKFFPLKNNGEDGLLHVSAIGGGTWITEFEVVSGIEQRFFGFGGLYVNSLVADRLKQSFPRYLRQKNYYSKAFFPIEGAFTDTEQAFMKYHGFDEFRDGDDLELESNWPKFSDVAMAKKIVPEFVDDGKQPFFYHVTLLENHSPHSCKKTNSQKAEQYFASSSDAKKNCTLGDYLSRLHSTESAVQIIQERLKEIEVKTNRPYIMVVYGDHQPWTFIDQKFNSVRTKVSQYFTFYKIFKSDKISLPKIKKVFHATLIPTLVSTAIAKDVKDLYIPENFYLFEKCGVLDDQKQCKKALNFRKIFYGNYMSF